MSLLATVIVALTPLQSAFAQGDTEVMTNAKVMQMVNGKLPKNLIIGKIKSARPGYDLSTEGLINLNGAKIDDNFITEMMSAADQARKRGDAPEGLVGFDETLTNEKIIKLSSSRISKGLIKTKMSMSRPGYDVSSTGMIDLVQNKVPEDLIKIMMAPPAPVVAAASTGTPQTAGRDRASTSGSPVAPPPKQLAPNGPTSTSGARTDAAKRASIAVYPLGAGGVTELNRYALGTVPIHASLAMRITQAFTKSGQWQVINRAADNQLSTELERTREMTNFRSPIIVADNQKVNARYVVTGLLEQVALNQGSNSNGCPTYEVAFHFTSEIGDVESATSVASKSFIAGYPSVNAESYSELAKLIALHKARDLLKKCKGKPSDVIEYALIDVTHQVEAWSTTALANRR